MSELQFWRFVHRRPITCCFIAFAVTLLPVVLMGEVDVATAVGGWF